MKTLRLPSLIGTVSILMAFQSPEPTVLGPSAGTAEESAVRHPASARRVVRRANTFRSSTQGEVAVDVGAGEDSWTVCWHSRRQQEGSYGVYARRFDALGNALSDEVCLNSTTAGMQMQPAVSADDEGGWWFAWRSFGQDGDEGSIVVRHFDSDLASATRERVVNATAEGHQSQPSITSLPDGGALVAWSGPRPDGLGRGIFTRRVAADGSLIGEETLVAGTGSASQARLPHVAADDRGRAVVSWARTALNGEPIGIFARLLDEDGRPEGETFRVDPGTNVQPVEPTLAVSGSGEFAIAWLDLQDAADPILWRSFERGDEGVEAGPLHVLRAAGEGYTSGHAIDLDHEGRLALSWTRHARNGSSAELFTQLFDLDGEALTESFVVLASQEGADLSHELAVGRGTSRVRLLADGRMGFAVGGNAGLGDSNAAHVALLLPEGPDVESPLEVARAELLEEPWFEPLTAAPHEPPTFRPRPRTERPDVPPNYGPSGALDFIGFTDTGFTPADPHMAVGPDHVVLVTNGGVAFFDTAGTFLFEDELEGSDGFFALQAAGNFVIDPEVIWDPHSQRFILTAVERAAGLTQPYFLLAISDDADPNGTWHKYRINVLTESGGETDIDSPNIGVDPNVIYLGTDFPASGNFLVLMIDKSSVLGGGAVSYTHTLIANKQSPGIPVTYDAGAPAQYMIRANKVPISNEIELFAITDALSTPVVQSTTLTLPAAYQDPETVPQAGTSTRIELFDARFWSCVYRDGSLWATHHTGGTQAIQRWYEFDMQGWPTSGNQPVLAQFDTIEPEFPVRAFFGSIAVDSEGAMSLLVARCAPAEFMSVEQASRGPNDPLNSTQPPVSLFTSTDALGGRRGDYGACVPDPDEPGIFWGHHEFADNGAWSTRVVRFPICPLGENYCVGGTHSGGLQARIGNGGTPRVGDNEFFLTVADGPADKFGLFFYGPNQVQISFGDGFRCVGGMTARLNPVVMTNSGGTLSQQIDLNSFGASMIAPDTTWNFQFWFRDPMGPGGSGFNLSDGISITFCP